jgi:hypothetical protein
MLAPVCAASDRPLSLDETIAEVVGFLGASGTPYMLVGSIASSVHGEPRSTLDIDVVVDPTPKSLTRLVDLLLRRGYYADPGVARQALAERSQFNAVDPDSGWKVDLIILRPEPFSKSEFARRQRVRVGDVEMDVASAEDTVIAKLQWAKHGQYERQLRDVVGILRVSGDVLDMSYIARWTGHSGRAISGFKY